MGCKAAVQALQKADALKVKVSRTCDLLNDSEAWTDQQELQTIYHQVLVLDLEYALDKKVEQELWTLGFKNHITTLQELARDKKNPRRSESQALLSWCLEAASGFYLTLLQELCSAFELDLPFRRKGALYGQIKSWSCSEQLNKPQSASCVYICQYCLVHLGDIARYRNQRKQAESFYRHAILLSPTSGHPYNQLALLQASQGDKLATVFHYIRGISVKHPFPAATTNLINTLTAAIDKDDPVTEIQNKMCVNDLILMFVRTHGLLHTVTDLDQAEFCVKSINATLTALVATQSFTVQKLIQMTIVNLYALKHIVGTDTFKKDDLTEDEIRVRELVLNLLAGALSAFLLPVYTLKHDETLLDYYALPAIKFIGYWIENEPAVLEENVFKTRLQIWPGLCKLLNNLNLYLKDFDHSPYEKTPLSEDKDLQGFLPLANNFKQFEFVLDNFQDELEAEKYIRAKRLVQFGVWLTGYDVNNTKLISAKENEDKTITFEPGCVQPDPTTDLLKEMQSFSVTENLEFKSKNTERRGGILKPQGSLEKSREEREQVLLSACDSSGLSDGSSGNSAKSSSSLKPESLKLNRGKQNVAIQSILKKMEESKQVKFNVDTSDKEKDKKAEVKKPAPVPTVSYLDNLVRTKVHTNTNFTEKDYFKPSYNFQNYPLDRDVSNSNVPFPQNEVSLPINTLPPFNATTPQQMYNSGPNLASMPSNFPHQQQPNSFNMQQFGPYQNQFPRDFNVWKQDERGPASSSNWWPPSPNQPTPPSNSQRDYQTNYPYSSYMSNSMDFKQNKQSNEMFGSSWTPMQSNPISNQGIFGYNGSNQGLSLRQAMLKETQHISTVGPSNANRNNIPSDKMIPMPSNAPGYSLFNPTGWNPNIPGQLTGLRTPPDGAINRQQSLFTGQPAQSLTQLLEQQNQFKKRDN